MTNRLRNMIRRFLDNMKLATLPADDRDLVL